MALELSGWTGTKDLEQKSLASDAVKAGAQIIRCGRLKGGWVAPLIGLIYGETFASYMVSFNANCGRPIDPEAFKSYHHSSKVRAQNIMVLEEWKKCGKAAGYDVNELSHFLERISTVLS